LLARRARKEAGRYR